MSDDVAIGVISKDRIKTLKLKKKKIKHNVIGAQRKNFYQLGPWVIEIKIIKI